MMERTFSVWEDYADGDIKRDTPYGLTYPFAPPIAITSNQQYVFHDQWSSLVNDNTRDVMKEDTESYFRLKLRSDEGFIDDLKSLIAEVKGECSN